MKHVCVITAHVQTPIDPKRTNNLRRRRIELGSAGTIYLMAYLKRMEWNDKIKIVSDSYEIKSRVGLSN